MGESIEVQNLLLEQVLKERKNREKWYKAMHGKQIQSYIDIDESKNFPFYKNIDDFKFDDYKESYNPKNPDSLLDLLLKDYESFWTWYFHLHARQLMLDFKMLKKDKFREAFHLDESITNIIQNYNDYNFKNFLQHYIPVKLTKNLELVLNNIIKKNQSLNSSSLPKDEIAKQPVSEQWWDSQLDDNIKYKELFDMEEFMEEFKFKDLLQNQSDNDEEFINDYKYRFFKYQYQGKGGEKEQLIIMKFNTKNSYETLNNIDFQFLDINNDGTIDPSEFNENIKKFFGSKMSLRKLQDYDKNNNSSIFDFQTYDSNNNNQITKQELYNNNFSKMIRNDDDIQWTDMKYDNTNNLLDFMSQDIENANCVLKGTCNPSVKMIEMYKIIRYLVEKEGTVIYINLYTLTNNNEEEVFNNICKDRSICKYYYLQFEDYKLPTPQVVQQFIDIVSQAIKNKHNVLVHCTSGMGRTGYMMLIYLIYNGITSSKNEKEKEKRKNQYIKYIDDYLDSNNELKLLDEYWDKLEEQYDKLSEDQEKIKENELEIKKKKIRFSKLYIMLSNAYSENAADEVFNDESYIKLARDRLEFLKKLIIKNFDFSQITN